MPLQDSNLELCINYLSEGKCILFLGPQFAFNEAKEKVHEKIRQNFQESSFKEKLDFHYDNLFIFNEPRPRSTDKMRLHIELKKQYKSVKPHPVYNTLTKLPFSAIISCSPDTYLKDAYKAQDQPVHFSYFSRKGANSTEAAHPEVPMLYNVFGNITDESSLITTYEAFFQFIISMMGEEQQMPEELRFRLKEAQIFVFMGFDFSRWYIPLLVHKLTSFKGDQDNTTALVDGGNKLDEQSVNYYPIEMLVVDSESIETIEALHGRMQDPDILALRQEAPQSNPIELITQHLGKDEVAEALNLLKISFQQRGLETNDIIGLEARVSRRNNNLKLKKITKEEGDVELQNIIEAALMFLEELENEAV